MPHKVLSALPSADALCPNKGLQWKDRLLRINSNPGGTENDNLYRTQSNVILEILSCFTLSYYSYCVFGAPTPYLEGILPGTGDQHLFPISHDTLLQLSVDTHLMKVRVRSMR